MATKKEAVYDKKINPLMAKIIKICHDNKIAMLASFALGVEDGEDDPDNQTFCTTSILLPEHEPADVQLKAIEILVPDRHSPLMMTVRDKDGKVTESIAIL